MRQLLVAIAILLAAAPAAAHEDLPGLAVCVEQAPGVTSCDLGTHRGRLTHGNQGHGTFNGTIETRLAWTNAAGEEVVHIWRCDWHVTGGSCAGFNPLPPAGASYRASCHTFVYRSETPGGQGGWRCYTAHTL